MTNVQWRSDFLYQPVQLSLIKVTSKWEQSSLSEMSVGAVDGTMSHRLHPQEMERTQSIGQDGFSTNLCTSFSRPGAP